MDHNRKEATVMLCRHNGTPWVRVYLALTRALVHSFWQGIQENYFLSQKTIITKYSVLRSLHSNTDPFKSAVHYVLRLSEKQKDE